MAKIKRVLGKRGRTTIPYEFRQILDLRYNDVLIFAITDDKTCVVITKEKVCNDCVNSPPEKSKELIEELWSRMSGSEKLRTLFELSSLYAIEEEVE